MARFTNHYQMGRGGEGRERGDGNVKVSMFHYTTTALWGHTFTGKEWVILT